MDRRKYNRFQRTPYSPGPLYTCLCCGRQTRETGEGESASEMCAYCYLEAGIDNEFSDGYITKEEHDRAIQELKTRYGRT